MGSSSARDDAGLTGAIKHHDIVVVQELVAPPYAGTFPNGKPFVPDAEARRFFDCMKGEGYAYALSEEDTGPGLKNHLNSSATEWWVVFYRTNRVTVATDLPSGFLSAKRAGNKNFDRVPYAFPFRSIDNNVDFVLISVHLRPGAGLLHKKRRKGELSAIAKWVSQNSKAERDFIVLGDMNIENGTELAQATPAKMKSLNHQCEPTNTNVNGPKPYDHVMFLPDDCKEVDLAYGFQVESLIHSMKARWPIVFSGKYPGLPYQHNGFRKYFSDHHPVHFRILVPQCGDDD